ESEKAQEDIIDVDIGDEFSTLDALDIFVDEKTTKQVSNLKINEEMEFITHVSTSEIRIQVSEVSSTCKMVSESNKPELLTEKGINIEILVEEDSSHNVKAIKDDEPCKTRKIVVDKTLEMAQYTTDRDEIIVDMDVQFLGDN
ncbi:hypothetical protein KI387_029469, partial [Taxus chinensis]